jgi:hypothetical protein
MKKLIFLLGIILCFSSALAQDNTFGFGQETYANDRGQILLVPWESKMYISDINREISSRTDLSVDEIKRLFREGFCQIFSQNAAENWDVIDLVTSGEEGHLSDLQNIHQSISYTYDPVPPTEEPTKTKSLLMKLKPKSPEEGQQSGGKIEQGEIYTYYDETEKYMNTQINNPELMSYLADKYEFEYVVFLNELDIRVLRDHNQEHGQSWDRQVKVHYTICDIDGKPICSSAAYGIYKGDMKDIYEIIRKNFPNPCQVICKDLEDTLAEQAEEVRTDEDY